jgi:hypothetical protein
MQPGLDFAAMTDSTVDDSRRLEVHFALDDEAMVLELSEDPDSEDVDELIGALHASDIDEAERRLGRTPRGPRSLGRVHRR